MKSMYDRHFSHLRMQMLLDLRKKGVTETNILEALEKVSREMFVAPPFRDHAYNDSALPLDCGQTISQPAVVGVMLQALQLGSSRSHKVLEVGTGTGYNAVLLSYLARRVYSIERHFDLYQQAQQNIIQCKRSNITLKWGDGRKGWVEQAPFKRIILTAATPTLPQDILEQLDVGGILVFPCGDADLLEQDLVRVTRESDKELKKEYLGKVKFVPLCFGVSDARN